MYQKKMLFAGITAFVIWLALGVALVAGQGCGTKYVSDTGRELPPGLGYAVQTLEASKTLYDASLTMAGGLHCDKKITDPVAWKIVKAANTYYLAHNALQIAIDGWSRAIEIKGDTESAKAATYIQLVSLAQSAIALTRNVKSLTGKGVVLPDLLSEENVQLVFGVK